MQSSNAWQRPSTRMPGLFADLQLFPDALRIAKNRDYVTRFDLEEELSRRLHGMTLVERDSPRRWADLIRELRYFGWLRQLDRSVKPIDDAKHRITPEGLNAYAVWRKDGAEFLRLLIIKMQDQYVIPGWFVQRLWDINPERSGEIVIPSPLKEVTLIPKKWSDRSWSDDLASITLKTYDHVLSSCPGSFPVSKGNWMSAVEDSWKRVNNLRRRKALPSIKQKTYGPRRKLALAMTEAAVKLLFSKQPPGQDRDDFYMRKEPISPRLFSAWCPRLEAAELIFYTDAHPAVSGRLLFPTAVFKSIGTSNYRKLDIKDPQGNYLWLHQPGWQSIKARFFETLYQEHHRASARVGSLYAPLLDVRDEVCRQLRLSANLFDDYLFEALHESLLPKSRFSISLETDVREDQRMAYRIFRRPVWVNGTPYSLIAMTEYRIS